MKNKVSLNSDIPESLNSDHAEMLGYTQFFLRRVAGTDLPENVNELAMQIAVQSAKLNHLCTKFDKLVSVARTLDIKRKQDEWVEAIAAKRALRVAKERERISKSLRGAERKHHQKTGELPSEMEARLESAFQKFMERRKTPKGE